MKIDYNQLLIKYDPLIKKYSNQYCRGLMPQEDFEQELRIRLWIKVDEHYCSAIGSLENYVFGVVNLESRKIRFDLSRQEQFELSSIFYCSSPYEPYYYEDQEFGGFHLNEILTQNETNYLNKLYDRDNIYFESSKNKLNKSKIASSIGVSKYLSSKFLDNIRKKIKIAINNQDFF